MNKKLNQLFQHVNSNELPEVLVYTDGMTVAELAKKIKREPAEIIKNYSIRSNGDFKPRSI